MIHDPIARIGRRNEMIHDPKTDICEQPAHYPPNINRLVQRFFVQVVIEEVRLPLSSIGTRNALHNATEGEFHRRTLREPAEGEQRIFAQPTI